MSVINQVLHQLEQRGAHALPEQTVVRAVPQARNRPAMPLLIVALMLAIGIAVWQWVMQARKPDVIAVNTVQRQPVMALPASLPASAVPAPAAVPDTAAAVTDEALPAEMPSPASRLSFELSSVPLPSSLREPKNNTGQDGLEEPAMNTAPPAQTAKPRPAQAASPNMRAAARSSNDVPPMKQVSPAQRADAEFHKAVESMQQGHVSDAVTGYEAALRLDAGHDAARQALVALLLESGRSADAERALQDGLKARPGHTGFAMLLARLQVERGAIEQAMAILEKSLPHADAQADYQAFFAALLQRRNRHKEAIAHYQIALQLAPDNGVWLMGYGISLQAVQRADDAREAFRRALESRTLTPELQAFVRQKLKDI